MSQGIVRDFKGRPLLSVPLSPQASGNPEHAGAILALMLVDEHGNAITDFSSGGGYTVDTMPYVNSDWPAIKTVKDALDLLLAVPMVVTLVGGGNYEHGEVVPQVGLSWSISKTIRSQVLYGPETLLGPGAPATQIGARAAILPGPFTEDTSWALVVTAADGIEQRTAQAFLNFFDKCYWGSSPLATLTDADILAMDQELTSTREQTRMLDGLGDYLWFAWPENLSAPSFRVNGAPDANWVETIRAFTNAQGYTTNYRIYRSAAPWAEAGIQVQVL